MRSITKHIPLLLLAAFLAGCGDSYQQSSPSIPEQVLTGQNWELVSLGEVNSQQPVLDQPKVTILFTEEAGGEGILHRIAGSAGCNQYTATFERDGDRFAIAQPVSTRMACALPIMAQETAYLEALQSAKRITRNGDRLEITYASGRLRFEAQDDGPDIGEMQPQETGRTFLYECEDFDFTMRTGPGEVALWLPERFDPSYVVLGQVRSASGAKYQDGDLVFWSKGEEALLEMGGTTYSGCTSNTQRAVWAEALRRGVDVRAVGQEPGWHLEITNGTRIIFVTDYGEREVSTPAPDPQTAAGQTTYRAETEAHTLTVVLDETPCQDVMSGEAYPLTVRVTLDGNEVLGCGRRLQPDGS